MKQQTAQSLREKTIEELKKLLTELESNLGTYKLEHAVSKLNNTASLLTIRKEIARVKTILREKV